MTNTHPTHQATSGKVLYEDLPTQATSAPDAEHDQRIKANGLECLGRIHGDLTFDDWLGAGAALLVITREALTAVGAFKWDANNKRAVKAFNARWDEYEFGAGANHKPLSKQERHALREIMTNPKITAWRSTLTEPEKRKLNHPNAVINRFKAQAIAKAPVDERKPSPFEQMKRENVALQEELHRMKQRGDGNAFAKNDTSKAVATAIIGTFDGLSNKTTKVEAIARELIVWVKQQRQHA